MITEFIDYLNGTTLKPQVELAFTMNPIEDYSEELPVILVYPLGSSGSPSGADNLVIQQASTDVVCLLGCAIGDYEALQIELQSAAVGWEAGGSYHAMEFSSASIEGLKGGFIWWREVYSVQHQIRQIN